MFEKINQIYFFLEENRQYNNLLQFKNFNTILSRNNSTEENVSSLLYEIVNTQSQPKIDKIALFFQIILEDKKDLISFHSFIKKISPNNTEATYKNLFQAMKKLPGWGEKTSALFTKTIYQIHFCDFHNEFKIWEDAPQLTDNDELFLPVDHVISSVFRELAFFSTPNFKTVNKFLKTNFSNSQIEVWDDLWFWGFMTQKGSGNNLLHTWNENKYWALKHSDKDLKMISEIKEKSKIFLNLTSQK